MPRPMTEAEILRRRKLRRAATRSWVSGDAMRDILVAPASEQDKSVVVIRRFCRRKKIADRIILEE